ncbi:uncharacterized protein LOC128272141 [Anopheles cruzii]|uniref:uncharacterized protein LOC128272141 n=1 Tax=Anopheles cruzii TaxID=68878 RepID=UPI0022EC734F|nr:uncharacterized protein LOC128272141 [Anopheles cruzii]
MHSGPNMYYVGNIPKKASDKEVLGALANYGNVASFEFRLEQCTYCPTKVAYVGLKEQLTEEQVVELNRIKLLDKRLLVASANEEPVFSPQMSVVIRYLNEHITEEDIYDFCRGFASDIVVQKPARSYAYVQFKQHEHVNYMCSMTRPMEGVDMYVVPVKRRIGMFLEKPKPVPYENIKQKCDKLGLCYSLAAENETTLLISNIPRDTEEDELLEFLGKFGKIVDWELQKSASCVLTNIGFVTYQYAKTARTVYLCGPLCFQGVGLDVYNHKLQYSSEKTMSTFIIKHTSVYLTTDEIFEGFSNCGVVEFIQRLDTVNYHTIVRMDSKQSVNKAFKVRFIGGECIFVCWYTANQYNTPLDITEEADNVKPRKRMQKQLLLLKIIETEDQRNACLLPTQPNPNYTNPNPIFYRCEVQVWNFPPNTGLAQFRERFRSYGIVINTREVKENADSPISVVYVSFETKLEAKRVCKLNQSFMGLQRLLILRADQNIVHYPQVCVKVSNLTDEITCEDIHDRFSMVDKVKYVFRPKVDEAIVCFVDGGKYEKALKILCIGRFVVSVSPLVPRMPILPMPMPYSVRNSSMGGMGGYVPIATPNMINDSGNGLGHSVPLPVPPPAVLAAPVPVPHPMGMPVAPIFPAGGFYFGPMGVDRTMNMRGTPITPLMRRLMQQVEAALLKLRNFTSWSMMDQFNLVHGIICQCRDYPSFLSLDQDEKIRYLIGGQNGFNYVNLWTLCTYPEQLLMLSVIGRYYTGVTNQGAIQSSENPSEMQNQIQTATDAASAETPNLREITTDSPLATTDSCWTNEPDMEEFKNKSPTVVIEDSDDDIPPAPSPPPISFRSRSSSPAAKQKSQKGSNRNNKQPKTSGDQCGRLIIHVSNIPNALDDRNLKDVFNKYGVIKLIQTPKQRPSAVVANTRTVLIIFATMHQATQALEANLTMLMGHLIKVSRYKEPISPRPGYAISVTCPDQTIFSEVAIYDTFKSCGDVRFIWTRKENGKKTCLIDYVKTESVATALKITYLHSGGRCRAVAIQC